MDNYVIVPTKDKLAKYESLEFSTNILFICTLRQNLNKGEKSEVW